MDYTIRDVLGKAWSDVENAYKAKKLNSERALQAVIYRSLADALPSAEFTVLVEPGWNCLEPLNDDCTIPDLVIVNIRTKEVACVLELKLAPHDYIKRPKILEDLWKLDGYRNTKKVRLDIFGPGQNFSGENKTGQEEFNVSKEVTLVFIDISRDNKDLEKDSYWPAREPELLSLHGHRQFLFLCAATDESGNADFSAGNKALNEGYSVSK